MKNYIKPSIHIMEIDSTAILAGSGLTGDGSQGNLTTGGSGKGGASMARVMGCNFGQPWEDDSFEDDVDDYDD